MKQRKVDIVYAGMADLGPLKSPQARGSDRGRESGPKTWHLVVALLGFRIVNALLSYSSFVPDEYWQALEVAHNMVFGYPNSN